MKFASATALYATNRLAVAGLFQTTLGLFLLTQIGEQVRIAGYLLGVATLTGLGLGLSTWIAMLAAPLMGGISDRNGNRWQVAATGLLPGMLGLAILTFGTPLALLFGIPLTAITSGSNQGLATALVGDLGNSRQQSRRLGLMFTAGDLASAIGPLIAYALIPWIGIISIYYLGAGLFGLIFLLMLKRSAETKLRPVLD
ncbi:MAG: MFS transporter [Anaerolineales bacterium]|nr:MFS transporter [Anaerolineales bacterium]